jgi:hypothetical protein
LNRFLIRNPPKLSVNKPIKTSQIFAPITVPPSITITLEIVKKYNELGEEGIQNRKRQTPKSGGEKRALLTDKKLEKLASA